MEAAQAIQIATETVKGLFQGKDHRLEEVRFKDDGDFEVTISYREPDGPRPVTIDPGGLNLWSTGKRAAIGIDAHRAYKDVLVKSDGSVKAVLMRQIVVG
jgi:hypothetical protein